MKTRIYAAPAGKGLNQINRSRLLEADDRFHPEKALVVLIRSGCQCGIR